MSTPAGDDLLGEANIRINADPDPAIRALGRLSRDAQGRIRDIRGRFVHESALIRLGLNQAAGGGDRFSISLRALAGVARSAAGVLGRAGAGIGALGAAAGSAAPLLAGIVTTLQNVAPAGAVAVTGMLAIQQASAVVQLGMVGIEDAATAAFDTSAAGAEKFNEAIEKLAPNAREFAVALREAQPAFQQLQQGVQNELFRNFGQTLQLLSTSVLPVLDTNLKTTATTLNEMAIGAALAADTLAADGTLGKAMAGANTGLGNLAQIPGQVVTALGQLAVAGAPAFDRITAAAARAATRISGRLSQAFESGALEDAVNTAVDLLRDLGEVGRNVFEILGNIMAPVQQAGGGLIGVLLEITGALRQATATQGFQQAIGALAGVMGTLARTVGPLLGQALAAIGPVFTALGPPVERLITNLGSALSPIITALGPVLAAAADAVGILVDALSPLLPVIGNLIASLLPPLVPLLQAVGDVFRQAGPVVQLLGNALATALAPILAQLPVLIQPLATHLSTMARTVFPTLAQLVVALAPSLAQMGVAFSQVLVAAAPLLTALSQLTVQIISGLMPVITPLIGIVGQLAAMFAGQLSQVLTTVVVPALNVVTSLLRGDFAGAWENAKRLVSGAINTIIRVATELPGKIFSALGALAGRLRQRATEGGTALVTTIRAKIGEAIAWVRGLPGRASQALSGLAGALRSRASQAGSQLVSAIRQKIADAVSWIRGLPGRAASALGNLGGRLYSSGRSLIQGFIDGIQSKIGDVTSAVGSLVDRARDLFPGSPAKEGPFSGRGWVLYSGQAISEALAEGMAQRAALVERAAAMVAGAASMPVASARPVADLGVGSMRAVGPAAVNVTYVVHVANNGAIGSQLELQNWFTRALDQAARTGRIPAALRTA